MDRGSQLSKDDEDDEDDKDDKDDKEDEEEEEEERRTRQEEAEEEEEQEEEEATDIKSNNPHLAGGEKQKNSSKNHQQRSSQIAFFPGILGVFCKRLAWTKFQRY